MLQGSFHVNSQQYSSMPRTHEGASQNTSQRGEGQQRDVFCLAEALLAMDGDQERERPESFCFKSLTAGRVGQPYSSQRLHIKEYIGNTHQT